MAAFHRVCGTNIDMSEDGKDARRQNIRDTYNTVLLSSAPLEDGVPFKVKVIKASPSLPVLHLGVTSVDPGMIPDLPRLLRDLRPSWTLAGASLRRDGQDFGKYTRSIKAPPGVTVGITWTDGDVSFQDSGEDLGVAFMGVPGPVWAVVSLVLVDEVVVR